jgi:hypothetical protein
MTYVFWDIETERLATESVLPYKPEFKAPSNYRDPDKIAANVAEQESEWLDKLALDAKTSRILAAGIAIDNDPPTVVEGDEKVIISSLLDLFVGNLNRGGAIVGFNSERFDWPFLRHRCLLSGIPFSPRFLAPWKGRFYWSEHLKDAYLHWTLGQQVGSVGNGMDNLAIAFGLPRKLGDGSQFAELYHTNRPAALDYLKHDVELTRALWQRVSA